MQGLPAPAQRQGRGEQLRGQGPVLHGYHGGADQEEEGQFMRVSGWGRTAHSTWVVRRLYIEDVGRTCVVCQSKQYKYIIILIVTGF